MKVRSAFLLFNIFVLLVVLFGFFIEESYATQPRAFVSRVCPSTSDLVIIEGSMSAGRRVSVATLNTIIEKEVFYDEQGTIDFDVMNFRLTQDQSKVFVVFPDPKNPEAEPKAVEFGTVITPITWGDRSGVCLKSSMKVRFRETTVRRLSPFCVESKSCPKEIYRLVELISRDDNRLSIDSKSQVLNEALTHRP